MPTVCMKGGQQSWKPPQNKEMFVAFSPGNVDRTGPKYNPSVMVKEELKYYPWEILMDKIWNKWQFCEIIAHLGCNPRCTLCQHKSLGSLMGHKLFFLPACGKAALNTWRCANLWRPDPCSVVTQSGKSTWLVQRSGECGKCRKE